MNESSSSPSLPELSSSSGVFANAGHDINIGGDVVGRDKIIVNVDLGSRRKLASESVFVNSRAELTNRIFVDRQGQLATLGERVSDGDDRLVIVVGPPGIGKTALVSKVCKKIEEDRSRTSVEKAVAANCTLLADQPLLLFSLYLPLLLEDEEKEKFLEQCWHNPTIPLKVKFERLLSGINQAPSLLVLENLEVLLTPDGSLRVEAYQDFLQLFLTQTHKLRILATSRAVLRIKKVPFVVKPFLFEEGLPADDALALLTNLGGEALATISPSLLSRIAEKTCGYPRDLEMFVALLRYQHVPDCEKLLHGEFQELRRDLLKEYHNLLNDKQLQVLQAWSIFNRPEPIQGLAHVLGEASPEGGELQAVLDTLVQDFFIGCLVDEKYEMHPPSQRYIYSTLSDTGPFSKQALHRRAADYYAGLLTPEDKEETPDAFMRWYKFERPEWQETTSEWLSQLVLAGDLSAAYRAVAKTYFDAFWWWGAYLEFPLCTKIVQLLKETTALNGQPFSDLLQKFHEAYPTEHRYKDRDQKRENWQTVKNTVIGLMTILGCEGNISELRNDAERTYLWVLLDPFVAEADHYLGEPNAHVRYLATLPYIEEIAELEWIESWILYYAAQILIKQGNYQEALENARQGWNRAVDSDNETRANNLRIMAEVYWRQEIYQRAWEAYQLVMFYAYRDQFDPQPADVFTIIYYGECVERLCDQVQAAWRTDPATTLQACQAMHAFWNPYWEAQPGMVPRVDEPVLRAWLTSQDRAALCAFLFPPQPVEAEARAYAATAGDVVAKMEEQVRQLCDKLELITAAQE